MVNLRISKIFSSSLSKSKTISKNWTISAKEQSRVGCFKGFLWVLVLLLFATTRNPQGTSGLYDSFWKLIGGTGCIEVLQANHCLSLAKSAGFEWLIYIRGIDKFLHTDTLGQGPGLLRRFFDLFPRDHAGLLVRRRDCGGLDQAVVNSLHGDISVSKLPPIFKYFSDCEPLAGLIGGGDLSYVPMMRPAEIFASMPTYPIMHNATQPRFVPVNVLRAQHFVRAFELGGTYGAQRLYEQGWDRTARARFYEAEHGLDWAIPHLRQ